MNVQLLTVLAVLCPATSAGTCADGKCSLTDETSLMQVQKSLRPGGQRKPEEMYAVATEAYTLEEGPTPPPGCEDQGCQGDGPNCDGNEFMCTGNGWTVTGWYKQCTIGGDTCSNGWKVRCAKCPQSVKSVTMPVPHTPKAPNKGLQRFSCSKHCGGAAPGGCYCDHLCTGYGDCCDDYTAACTASAKKNRRYCRKSSNTGTTSRHAH